MATLIQLANAGALFKADPALQLRVQEERLIYVRPSLKDWMLETLPTLGSTWNIELTPLEQLDAFFEVFCSGATLTYDAQFKVLRPIVEGIWELKTADLRIFGWFHARDCFIGVDANTADTVKRLRLYRPYVEQAVRFRDSLDLDEPKFVQGTDPHAVVSAYDPAP